LLFVVFLRGLDLLKGYTFNRFKGRFLRPPIII
jgi:hypothetical protein